jgi:molecular chaperone GrpE (heat shock protein)
MNDAINWKVPKWPFFLADALVMGFAYFFIMQAPHAIHHWWIAALCVAFGAVLGIIPFYLDYRAMGKVIEINALGSVADKIQSLEQFCAQISAATGRWAAVQEFVGENAEKTATSARQIADKMGAEVREFTEFMKKMNDNEKAALRLEVDKLRRGETEWLQMLVRILDHIYALQVAAVRSNQPKAAEQITQFQNACRGAVRRVGLICYVGEPNEPFDASKHQSVDGKKPTDGATIGETIGAGYTFQGKLLRPALVRLRDANTAPASPTLPTAAPTPAPAPVAPIIPEKPKSAESDEKTFVLDAN